MSAELSSSRSDAAPPPGAGDAVLVTQFFPPFNIIASQRALRMARVLLAEFERVHVITLPTDNLPANSVDNEFGRAELSHERINVLRVRPWLDGYGVVARPKALHRAFGALLMRMLCSTGADWMRPLRASLESIARERQIRLIVSSGSPYVPFLTVIRFARRRAIRSILDYRDLWTQNPRAPYPKASRVLVGKTLERYANEHCDRVITVSNGCRASLLGDRPHFEVTTLMNTPDASYREWFQSAAGAIGDQFDADRLNIVLTGTVYRECTCRTLLRAMASLPATLRSRVVLHYYGSSSQIVRPEFEAAGMRGNLVEYGVVSKLEAAQAVARGDLLLSLVYDGAKGQSTPEVRGLMTTKVFDYFLSGKPILNVGPPEADVCLLAQQMSYGEFVNFDSSEVEGIGAFLRAALDDLTVFRRRRADARLPDFSETLREIVRNVVR